VEEHYDYFIHDAEELIEKLFRDIEELRDASFGGRHRREVVSRLFRNVHTMKGSAASHDAKPVSLIAHEIENVLDAIRLGRLPIDEGILDAFEYATNEMSDALAALSRGKGEVECGPLIDRLRAITSQSVKEDKPLEVRSFLPREIASSLSEYDEQHLRDAIHEGSRLFIVSADFEIETFDEKFRELSRSLNQAGEIICTVPAPEPAATGEINFRLLYAAQSIAGEVIERASDLGRIEFSEIVSGQLVSAVNRDGSSSPGRGAVAPADSPSDATVRVGLNQLNEIISEASELFRDATAALESLTNDANKEAVDLANSLLRRRFIELEERLIKLRLVPLGRIFERVAARAGRSAARELGKEVEFVITGGEVGVDRSLAETITGPLFHLVRNSISHGIESPEERSSSGKSTRGQVNISACSKGSHIHICVTDDGRGIVRERIAAVAEAQGIVTAGSALSIGECLRLIFRPGFSTAEALSDVAGRGIGLDVVDRAMALAGGEVRVTTKPGIGTTFEMILPATLALVRCVMVRCADQDYCFETTSIVDRGAVANDQLKRNDGDNVLAWQGKELPLFRLSTLLGRPDSNETNTKSFLVIERNSLTSPGDRQDRIALLVDSIEDEHEILVRSLGRHAARWRGVSGATELFDGRVALVLDLEELLER